MSIIAFQQAYKKVCDVCYILEDVAVRPFIKDLFGSVETRFKSCETAKAKERRFTTIFKFVNYILQQFVVGGNIASLDVAI